MNGWCRAISQSGVPLIAYIGGVAVRVVARPDRYFICTQDASHRGGHSSCDGHGHILATWDRRKPEQYWHRADCDGCDHHGKAVTP